jgi:hypothetical protein
MIEENGYDQFHAGLMSIGTQLDDKAYISPPLLSNKRYLESRH